MGGSTQVAHSSTPVSSCGACDGTATATLTVCGSPSGAATYSWSTTPVQTTQTATNLCPGNYTVTIALGCGTVFTHSSSTTYTVLTSNGLCTNTASISVTVSPPPVAIVSGKTICAGQLASLIASGGATYSWNTGSTSAIIFVAPSSSTTYSVTVSIGACSDSASASVIVNPVPTASAWNNVTITHGTSTTLSASGSGSYVWSNSFTDSTITVTPSVTTIYCVTVSNGSCTDTACVTVVVEPTNCSPFATDAALVVPSAFSPNDDGQNDTWRLLFLPEMADCIAEFEVFVYSRWGEKVFEGTNIAFSWDGTFRDMPEGTAVFAYHINAILKDGTKIKKSGNITLFGNITLSFVFLASENAHSPLSIFFNLA